MRLMPPISIKHNPALMLLIAAVAVVVAAMSAVGLFVDRVERALLLQGSSLLAADRVIEQTQAFDPAVINLAQQNQIEYSQVASFPSVVFLGKQPQLLQIKAVDEAYPLRGQLKIKSASGDAAVVRLQSGQAYLDPKLILKGSIQPGEQFEVGDLALLAEGEIIEEPDRGGSLFQLAPRLLINYADMQKTGLVGAGSRVRYRLLLRGESAVLDDFIEQVKPSLAKSARFLDISNARPELRQALERGQRFMGLAVLCSSLLAGITLLLATRHYVNRSLDNVAIFRTIGMTAKQVLKIHLWEIATAFVIGGLIGLAIGYGGQMLLTVMAADLFVSQLPAAGWQPYVLGLLYGAILLPGFVWPELSRLKKVSPLRVIRRELEPAQLPQWLMRSAAIISFLLLALWQAGELKLALVIVALLAVLIGFSMLVGQILLVVIKRFMQKQGSLAMGIVALQRNESLTRWQLSGFAIGISLLLILAIVRIDLLSTWQNSLPENTPDHFLINIQPDEKNTLQQWFVEQGIQGSGMKATARARLLKINDTPIEDYAVKSDRGERLMTREHNIGFSNTLSADNRILQGESWPPAASGLSIEQSMAEEIGLKPGMSITFEIAGQQFSAPIVNIRSVAWDSFNVNFFVQVDETSMQGFPVTYLQSLYLNQQATDVASYLAENYPTVSMLDLRPLMQQVKSIIERGISAVEAVFIFTLIAAILLTIGAVMVNRAEKAREIAILRTLGASRKQIILSLLTEYGLLGLMSGLVAATMAALTGYLVAWHLFELVAEFNPWLWLAGVGVGVLLLLMTGLSASYKLIGLPPLQVIQQRRAF